MTGTECLKSILKSQDLTEAEKDTLENCRADVERCLRDEFGSEPRIRYAGSKSKGTMVHEDYDLDIVCCFPSSETASLADLYERTSACLACKYQAREKTSAIRIWSASIGGEEPRDFHIDVVPVRLIDENSDNAFIHLSPEGYMKTNIARHVDYVVKSGLSDVIRLAKLWKVRHQLSIRTFALEILAVRFLEKPDDSLESDMVRFLSVCKDNLPTAYLLDPANTNNVISDLMSGAVKEVISKQAALDLNAVTRDSGAETGQAWMSVMRERAQQTDARVSVPRIVVDQLPKPWGYD
jgi:hypothetical protein